MQREVLALDARDNVVVAGRGTGKGVLHAAINLRNMQFMPRSTTGIIAPNAKRALTNTLPSMFVHWEAWGYRRGVHWVVGRRPPRELGWQEPIYTPDNYDNIISFYTGAVAQIVSQDRKGTSNSKSFDFLDIDEAKFIDFAQLKDETFPANRGQTREFGHLHFHHGMLVTSDMPVSRKGSWFLNYETEHDPSLVSLIMEMDARVKTLRAALSDKEDARMRHALRSAERDLTELRRHCLFYRTYSSLENMEILGEDFIRQQYRDLPYMTFRTSILCLPLEYVKDGFYSDLGPQHKYSAPNFSYLDGLDYDVEALRNVDSRMDADVRTDAPLCVAFDYNANINWLVCGQPSREEGRLRVLKSFFVKYERKLPELVADFCDYFSHQRLKHVVFYYDTTAVGSNYAVNDEDFKFVIIENFRRRGWDVTPVYIGQPMNHMEKHLFISQGLKGLNELMPVFNEENNEDLLISIRTAGVYNGKKDKRGEKLAETEEDRLESRTDGSDAFDTLYIGCERFSTKINNYGFVSSFT